ncbi:hypothetical protein BWQ96_09110 [Gracilariopsis chorda]|uniref:Apple domain-containing protein n=1 Tax=Gracilariopsis chorda TaxID=448386 RepID=A0A2V3IGK5_9FLOR|nr:hypothetical protein BWQ96_09110 [Gracilariopsis chorda]|eukprot:PXF41168.1 hypothetical protein BWQ96_09110 [Gracilariopsis chorda]
MIRLRHSASSILLLLSLAAAVLVADGFNWQTSSDAMWAMNCDFRGNDVGSAQMRGEDCSRACDLKRDCSHFAWTRYNGGTCWFKNGRSVSQSSAIPNPDPGAVCGILRSLLIANGRDSFGMTPHDPFANARPYLPIFRFDDDAGGWCFPDDKEAQRDKVCNGRFDRRAPVYVHSKQCGQYTVYQYNLWYGWQKGCVNQLFGGGRHGDDNEYVQVWTLGPSGPVARVRYNQHNGYYFREPGRGAEMHGSRPVVYIGKIAHGAYHRGCTGGKFWQTLIPNRGTDFCVGGCAYWDDFRNSEDGNFVMDEGTLRKDPSPREIDCDAPNCTPGHNSWRSPKSAACFGLNH